MRHTKNNKLRKFGQCLLQFIPLLLIGIACGWLFGLDVKNICILFLAPFIGYLCFIFSLIWYQGFNISLAIGIFNIDSYCCGAKYLRCRSKILLYSAIEEVIFRFLPVYFFWSMAINHLIMIILISIVFSLLHIRKKADAWFLKHLDLFAFSILIFILYQSSNNVFWVILIHYYRNIFILCSNSCQKFNEQYKRTGENHGRKCIAKNSSFSI